VKEIRTNQVNHALCSSVKTLNLIEMICSKQRGFSYVDIIDNDIAIGNVLTLNINKLINIYSNTGLRY